MTPFAWMLLVVTVLALLWLAAVIRQNRELHRDLEQDAARFEALAQKVAEDAKRQDESLGFIVGIYEGALDSYRGTRSVEG